MTSHRVIDFVFYTSLPFRCLFFFGASRSSQSKCSHGNRGRCQGPPCQQCSMAKCGFLRSEAECVEKNQSEGRVEAKMGGICERQPVPKYKTEKASVACDSAVSAWCSRGSSEKKDLKVSNRRLFCLSLILKSRRLPFSASLFHLSMYFFIFSIGRWWWLEVPLAVKTSYSSNVTYVESRLWENISWNIFRNVFSWLSSFFFKALLSILLLHQFFIDILINNPR